MDTSFHPSAHAHYLKAIPLKGRRSMSYRVTIRSLDTLVILFSVAMAFRMRSVAAWVERSCHQRRAFQSSSLIRRQVWVDDQGRRIRNKQQDHGRESPSNTDDWGEPSRERRNRRRRGEWNNDENVAAGGGWDDDNNDGWFDSISSWDDEGSNRQSKQPSFGDTGRRRTTEGGRRDFNNNSGRRSRPRESSFNSRNQSGSTRYGDRSQRYGRNDGAISGYQKENETGRINVKALEGAGFVHLYGLSVVANALKAKRRDFVCDHMRDIDADGDAVVKPEAQFSPWLLVQEQKKRGGRSADKALLAEKVLEMAHDIGIPVHVVDKGVLNTLSSNRPHQGYVLRCGPMEFEPLTRIPSSLDDPQAPSFWLALDEVVDPQNLGALIRSAYFLGTDSSKIGVVVCAKNSAPPSAVVSAASAGALELVNIYSTNSLPRLLANAEQDGFRIVGASSSVPKDCPDVELYDLQDLPSSSKPTILVLGSEGHGLRSLVARSCTDFVRIPGGTTEGEDGAGVDSLNVSVSGGIFLWHFLNDRN